MKLLLAAALVLAAGGLVYWSMWNSSDKESRFVYEEFLDRYPVFAKEGSATKENAKQIAMEFEQTVATMKDAPQTVAYARYLVVRAYVNAVIADWGDQESLSKALDHAAALIGDENGYPNIRAYTVALVDTLLYPSVRSEVKVRVKEHPYFAQFATDDSRSVSAFRSDFLKFGNDLARMTDLKMRLAIVETQRLALLKRGHPEAPVMKERIAALVADADASLARDKAGEMPFGNRSYLVEPLFHRAELAKLYFLTTGERPFGDTNALYTEALQAADADMPKLRPLIEFSQAEYQKKASQ